MRSIFFALQLLISCTCALAQNPIDTFKVVIVDSSRWLEDTKSAAVQAWVAEENQKTRKFFDDDSVELGKIYHRLLNIKTGDEFRNVGIEGQEGNLFYTMEVRKKGENLFVHYLMDDPLDAEPSEFLNPHKMLNSPVLKGTDFTNKGNLCLYRLSYHGSDKEDILIRDIKNKIDLPDTIRDCIYVNTSWYKEEGFFYNYPANPGSDTIQHALFFHKVGARQHDDQKIFQVNAINSAPYATVVDDKYLIITSWSGRDYYNEVYFKDLGIGGNFQKIISLPQGRFTYFGRMDSILYFLDSSPCYPNSRIIAYNIKRMSLNGLTEVIPEGKFSITGVDVCDSMLVLRYLKDVSNEINCFDLNGKFLFEIKMPVAGTIKSFQGKPYLKRIYIGFESYTYPFTLFEFDTESKRLRLIKQVTVDFNPGDFEVEKIFFESYDGTRVPLFICYKKGLKKDGTNPTWLYGYGGFNISYTPFFSGAVIYWMEQGGVYALANIRGGGEYGEVWHEAAKLERKQCSFDDFQAAAEYLINEGYTCPKKLAIEGGSNGGLLVAACANQRPNLFGAVICSAPLIDMLRFHKVGQGMNWTNEYGNPENPNHFGHIYKYSPLHNIRPLKYPATLILADANDDRTTPIHPYKYCHLLQQNQMADSPVLLRIEMGTGHANYQKFKAYRQRTDIFAFLKKVLDF